MEKRKERKRSRSLTAISIRLAALLLTLWLMCMACLTLGTTQYVFAELTEKGAHFAEYAITVSRLDELYSGNEWGEACLALPGAVDYYMNVAMADPGVGLYPPAAFDAYSGMSKKLSVFADEYIECRTAMCFLDTDGNAIRESGDYVYFPYITEETWQNGDDGSDADGFSWLDIAEESDGRYDFLRVKYAGVNSLYDYNAMRITGYFDGSRIEPLAMAVLTDRAYYTALDEAGPGWDVAAESNSGMTVSKDGASATVWASGGSVEPPYTMGELDAMKLIEWDVRFDNTAQAEPGQELVTIYALRPEMTVYDKGGAVSYQNTERHETLLALLETMGGYADAGRGSFYRGASKFNLFDTVVFSSWGVYDRSKEDGSAEQPNSRRVYLMQTALRASPLLISMRFLRNVYIASFALALTGFLALRKSLKKKLLLPLQEISKGMDGGFTHIPMLVETPPRWKEPYELWEHYRDASDKFRSNKNERNRLATALDYAKAAEQNRRRMTSGIAHELKTPLAVIHSYAEGLREHIADDKRDKYLDVILAESERMDGMVLEMLDLSRLEAGKVTLSRDEFSLSALSRGIFEKLALAAEAKGLKIEFQCVGPDAIVADEARIAQVIENFAVNAVKYTPPGGKIRVSVTSGRMGATLTVENDSKPFTMEELARVWDTFYRADEARSGGGTGLGLAIAKSIVELHGGTCAVRNTGTGVAFSFTI